MQGLKSKSQISSSKYHIDPILIGGDSLSPYDSVDRLQAQFPIRFRAMFRLVWLFLLAYGLVISCTITTRNPRNPRSISHIIHISSHVLLLFLDFSHRSSLVFLLISILIILI